MNKGSGMHEQIDRFNRHILLRMIGPEGQKRIEASRVFVAGLGALGSLISILLARAGVGFLRIADQDNPELHNLHRQVLYDEADLNRGLSKAQVAEERLRAANSSVEIHAVTAAVGADNVEELTEGVDVVVDALDNIRTRYFINDVVLKRGIPYVFGGAVEAAGNVMTIIPGETPCLRCLWPDSSAVSGHPTAATHGVLSSAAATVAAIEATETLKLLAGRTEDRLRGLLVMDLWHGSFHVAHVERDPQCICNGIRP